MAWGSEQSATQLTGVGATTTYFDLSPQLADNEKAFCVISIDFPAAPTDHAIAQIEGTTKDSPAGGDWTTTPISEFYVLNGDDPNLISVLIRDVYKFRIGIRNLGTGTITGDLDVRIGSD